MSAIYTADDRAIEKATNAALADVSAVRVWLHTRSGYVTLAHDAGADLSMIRKAKQLARMAVSGPEHAVICADHDIPKRPDRWEACRRVPVVSALLGRTCGAP